MKRWSIRTVLRQLALLWLTMALGTGFGQSPSASWRGALRDAAGNPRLGASVELRDVRSGRVFSSATDAGGAFTFSDLPSGSYSVSVRWRGGTATAARPLEIREGDRLDTSLAIAAGGDELILRHTLGEAGAQTSGGERLSSRQVSELPLNKRDFSQLLLLAAGTMTDTNGAANFTQQFAINGQRATTAMFAMDGIDVTDPELGGATLANFNVDAIEEVRADSGVLPPELGRGAAGFTNVISKAGGAGVHGSVFEFLRNAALDARNFFDRRTLASPGRLPPFARNEFGLTNGGPVVLPGLYDGRRRTFYFGQYQGFRQVLGTTQVFPVPSVQERQGVNTTAIPGDTLLVPVSPKVAPVLAAYPFPNDPQGPYGARTYAASSRVSTTSNQFSIRLDHRISDKSQLFARFNFNDATGPTINPSQVAIDASFATRFFDHQRNFGLAYTRSVSPHFISETSFGFVRSTPFFQSFNHTQPGLDFGDGLYEPFHSAAGGIFGSFGNLFQARQNFTYVRGAHSMKVGFEARFNRDTTIFGLAPNGLYRFGGGPAYAQVEIRSLSGLHDIHPGDPLPDALTGFLTATPHSFSASVAGPLFAQGDHIGESAIRRESYNAYFQDAWKVSPRIVVSFGLRYEVNTRVREAKHRTSLLAIVGPEGQAARYWDPGARQKFLYYPQPPYDKDWTGWGPRLSLEWRPSGHTLLRAGGAITTILPNLFQNNALTGGIPFVFNPYFTAAPGQPVPFESSVTAFNLPPIFTPQGQPVFVTPQSTGVPANTEIDVQRFQEDLAAVTAGNQIQPLLVFSMSKDFANGYIETFTAGLEHTFGDVKLSASYVGTAGVKLASLVFPNSYGGADPPFAPFTHFDAEGHVLGGYGPELFMSSRSHSAYHSLQVAAEKNSTRAGLGFQASYTLSKSLDDTSSVFGGFGSGTSGAVLQAFPQNPWNPGAERGPSTFDIRHIVVFSLIQTLPLDRLGVFRPLGKRFTSGWQFLNISTLIGGSPFSVFSGVQQTGVGSFSADRPDLVGQPVLSTGRTVREDYFGLGDHNADFFFVPIGVDGGTGPNQGRFGTLGRNTFRGPAFHNFDVALIKDTPFGRRGNGEAATLQFRAEFFNVFNLVNLGLPANIVRGSGFGLINRTAGTSRQIQFSLKLIY